MTPDDTTGGNSVNIFLKSIADECVLMNKKIQSLSEALVDTSINLAKEKRKNTKWSLSDIIKNIGNFFKRKKIIVHEIK